MQDQQQFVMVTPAPGFTTRGMTRILENEERRARRRALLGALVLGGGGGVFVGFGAWQLGVLGWQVLTRPQVLVALVDGSCLVATWLAVFLNAVWITIHALATILDPTRLLLMTLIVCGLVVLWARVMANVFHLSSNYVGG
ncbi:MAG: hypothetical protein N2559_04000 [Anaerolineae bacterium]|nr:hypothetical protein [Anaerolineae bacterium]